MSSLPNSSQVYNLERFRGEFNASHPTGEPRSYSVGEKVLYEGKLFVALSNIQVESPDNNSSWVCLGSTRVSYRNTRPQDPEVGDMWVNYANGRTYTFIDDGENKQFVEL